MTMNLRCIEHPTTTRPATAGSTVALLCVLWALPAMAQSVSGDARDVGLAGFEYGAKLLHDDSETPTLQFAVPLGLLQMIGDRQALRPNSGRFDPTLLLEYAAVPTHYVIGRKSSPARARFIADIRQAGLNPDLNVYRGFHPVASLEGAGLLAPMWGKAFTVAGSPARFLHKVYVGAGPYLAIETAALFDQRLVSLLGASSATYVPGSSLEIGNQSVGQVAAQFTGGYRGQLQINGHSRLDVAASYNHLQGFRYEGIDLNLRLDTNGQGLLALDRSRGAPLAIDRQFSSSGRGLAIDLAAMATFGAWRMAVSADGIANRIDWKNVTHREYELQELTGGASRLLAVQTGDAADLRARLPVSTRVQGAYVKSGWGAVVELQQGFLGTTAGAALERRFRSLELRTGARLVNRIVLPAAGVSVKTGPVWLDVGAAMSTANIERQRNVVVATSIRFVFAAPPPPVQ